MRIGGQYNYWCREGTNDYSCSGLVCSSDEVFRCLENLKDLKNLEICQWTSSIGEYDTIFDLSNTGLIYADIYGISANIYFPNTITKIGIENRYTNFG